MRNLAALLDEAKWGKLTNEEIAYVVQKLESCKPGDDDNLYTLIHILGKAHAKQYKRKIESFLYYPSYSMITKIALQTLCCFWGYYQEYLTEIKKFMRGVEWDDEEQIRIIAISSAGQSLSLSYDHELLQLLIQIFENEKEEESIREMAYFALATAMGQSSREIITKGFDISVIEQALQKLNDRE